MVETGLNGTNLIKWLQDNPADIKCFQVLPRPLPPMKYFEIIGTETGYHHSFQIIQGNQNGAYGMAIFSKYPIINEGIVLDSRRTMDYVRRYKS